MNQSPLIDSFVLPRRGLGFRDPILDGNLEMILVFACWISRERERDRERGGEKGFLKVRMQGIVLCSWNYK